MRELERFAQRFRRRAEENLQRELLRGEEELGPFVLARLSYQEVAAAFALKRVLLEEFAGAKLEELYECEERENELGRVLRLVAFHPELPALPDRHQAERLIASELRLLWGVGPSTAARLRAQGYTALTELVSHPRFGPQAQAILEDLQAGDLSRLLGRICRFFPQSHPLALSLLGLVRPERLVLFDLESLGLFGRPLVLLGLARPHDGGLLIEQYVIRSIVEEQAALVEAARALERAEALVTYNGRAFDLNYLEERLSYYGLDGMCRPRPRPNFDLLHHVRRRFGGLLPDCRLETVERYLLGLERAIDVPSALVPDFYNTYLEEQNVGPLVAIIEHNRQDLASLARLLGRLRPPS